MMNRIPGVPLLPGTVFYDIQKGHNPRVQKFTTYLGVNMLSDRKKPALVNQSGTIEDSDCPTYQIPSLYPQKTGPKLPSWLAYDKKVLRFYGYFKVSLPEVDKALLHVRKVKILYYLEDGTMQISEPRVDNSGIAQGCLVNRQRIFKSPKNRNDYISILDLNVNSTIRIYDRIYHITGCDLFTRHFLNRAGIHVPDPVEIPIDPSTELRKQASVKPYIPLGKHDLAQFLELDRKVLKFYAYWDDKSEFGDVRNLEIYYYLGDDTVEIRERFPKNSGRDAPGTFMRRRKLEKEWIGLPLPGVEARKTVLNVLGGGINSGRYMEDILRTGERKIDYYTEVDFQIGGHVNLMGRDVIITDCDEFTKEFYRKKYGIEDFTPLRNLAVKIPSNFLEKKQKELPPFNGWGTHESSEGNCKSVLPKPPYLDLKKFIHLDRFILRFGAKMFSIIPENCDRIFIISYYLVDETVSIYELATRNSGFLGGVFLKRKKLFTPKQNMYTSKPPQCYKPHHFYISCAINLNDHIFNLVSADEYTLIYMENHPAQFPYADIETIMSKIREAIRPIYKNFIAKYLSKVSEAVNDSKECVIDSNDMREALIELLDSNITDHEIITVCRHFSHIKQPAEQCNRETVRASTHLEIQRNLWDDLERFKEHIHQLEPETDGFVSETRVRSFLIACRLPFSIELTDKILRVINRNHCGKIEICDLVSFLDLRNCRAPAIQPLNLAFELCPKIPFLSRGILVDWNKFLEKLGLEDELKKEGE